MKTITFTVAGAPVAQPRQRHRIIQAHGRVFATNYTPAKDPVQSWKSFVRDAAYQAGAEIMTGPIKMAIVFFLPRPQSLCRKKDPEGTIPHTGSKDVDNLYKAVTDCLIGVCYRDDKQIFEARIMKFYHEKSSGPRAEIELQEVLI